MENTVKRQETSGFTVFALAALVAPAIAVIISYFTGAYSGFDDIGARGMMPDVAFYVLDAVTRFIFGVSLYYTVTRIAESDGAKTLKTIAVSLWLVSFVLSLIWLPVFFTMGSYMAAFVILAIIVALTTAQFIVNLKISRPAALMILPYWAFVIYCAVMNLMIAL